MLLLTQALEDADEADEDDEADDIDIDVGSVYSGCLLYTSDAADE